MVSSIVDLDQQYGDQLVVIGVNSAEDLEVVRAFIDGQQDVTYLNLIGDVKTMQAYRLWAHPFLVLVTPEGQMFHTYLGYTDKAILEGDIRALLGLE